MIVSKRYQILCCVIVLFVCKGYCTTCHVCEGQTCLRTTQVNTTVTSSSTTDQCVAIFSGYVPIKKGLYSTLTAAEKVKCDSTSDNSCYVCSTDRCNSFGRSDHKCKVCTGTMSSSTCLNNLAGQTDSRCTAPRSVDVYCSTKISGNTTTRGCVSSYREIKDCQAAPGSCSLCQVNSEGACNTNMFPTARRTCLFSANTTTTATSMVCGAPDDSCVSLNYLGNVQRMCSADLTADNKTFCSKYSVSCTYCSTNDCNTVTPEPNSVGRIALSPALSCMAMLIVAVLYK